jgi:hypothetical protein
MQDLIPLLLRQIHKKRLSYALSATNSLEQVRGRPHNLGTLHSRQSGLGQLHLRLLGAGHQAAHGQSLALHHQHQFAALAPLGEPKLLPPCMFDSGPIVIEDGPSGLADRPPLGLARP